MKRRLAGLLLVGTALLAAPGAAATVTPEPDPSPPAVEEEGILDRLPSIPNPIDLGRELADCTSPPPVGAPYTGPANTLDPGPAEIRAGDPFAPGADVSPYEVYGWSGVYWPDYELGCLPNAVGAPGRSALGAIARVGLVFLVAATAFTSAVIRYALDPNTLNILDPIVEAGVGVVGVGLWVPLSWITLAVTGVLIIWAAFHSAAVGAAGKTAGRAFVITLFAAVVVLYPLAGVGLVDRAMNGAVTAVNQAAADAAGTTSVEPADAIAGNLQRGVIYSTWLAGNFGRYDGECATTYGPRLFAASTVTRTEQLAVQGDQGAARELATAKTAEYREVAAEIKEECPQSYDYLSGNANEERILYVAIGWMAFLTAGGFLLVASLVMMYALIALRLVFVAIPVVAIIAVLPGQRHHLTKPLAFVISLLATSLRLSAIAAVFGMLMGALIVPGTGIPIVLLLILMALLTVTAWRLAAPWQSFKTLTGMRYTKGVRKNLDDYLGEEQSFPDMTEGQAAKYRRDGRRPTGSPYPEDRTATIPAEGGGASAFVRDVGRGVLQGAATGATLAVVTGGASALAGAGAGAAKTAPAAAAAAMGTRPDVPALNAAPVAALPPGTTPPTPAAPATPSPSTTIPPTMPGEPPMRIYQPSAGDQVPAPTTHMAPSVVTSEGTVYNIYTPPGSDT